MSYVNSRPRRESNPRPLLIGSALPTEVSATYTTGESQICVQHLLVLNDSFYRAHEKLFAGEKAMTGL